MNTLVETLIRTTECGLGDSIEEINEAMLDLGWASAGAIAPPYSRHWEAEGIRFNVFESAGGWCADVLFREVWPEDEEDLGSDAVAKACEAEEPYFRETMRSLLRRISDQGLSVEPVEQGDIDADGFVSWAAWRIGDLPFVMGVASVDAELPVSVMARFSVLPD